MPTVELVNDMQHPQKDRDTIAYSFISGWWSERDSSFLQDEVMFPRRQDQPDAYAKGQHNEDTTKKYCPKQDKSKSKRSKLSSSPILVSAV